MCSHLPRPVGVKGKWGTEERWGTERGGQEGDEVETEERERPGADTQQLYQVTSLYSLYIYMYICLYIYTRRYM